MISNFKRKIKIILNRMSMFSEYYHDYKMYKHWNYNNPTVHTQGAQESKILRQTHIIEKGLSLSNPRKGFGQTKIQDLFQMLDTYLKLGYPIDGIPFRNAICVLNQYVEFQKGIGYENEALNKKLMEFQKYVAEPLRAGIAHTSLKMLEKDIHGEFPSFFASRHSVRQFSEKSIKIEDVRSAVGMAMKAPTACNRQACKVYFYDNLEINKKLGALIAGNTGFENEVKNYLVITADMSAFYDTFERNQVYIEAGIFTMALVEALHYVGIGSCILQNGEYFKKNKKFKAVCKNIPDNEKIAVFVAIGYYKEEFNYAISKRKELESVLIEG